MTMVSFLNELNNIKHTTFCSHELKEAFVEKIVKRMKECDITIRKVYSLNFWFENILFEAIVQCNVYDPRGHTHFFTDANGQTFNLLILQIEHIIAGYFMLFPISNSEWISINDNK